MGRVHVNMLNFPQQANMHPTFSNRAAPIAAQHLNVPVSIWVDRERTG